MKPFDWTPPELQALGFPDDVSLVSLCVLKSHALQGPYNKVTDHVLKLFQNCTVFSGACIFVVEPMHV